MDRTRSYTIGLDLGGTKIAAALVRGDGQIIDFIKIPLHLTNDATPQAAQRRVVSLMADICLDFRKRFPERFGARNFRGVGLASAGPMNVEEGKLIHPANFPGWKVVPLQKNLEKALARRSFDGPVFFQNDAMAAAFAELYFGAARGQDSFAVVTVGTGIGSGVIVNGRPCQTRGAGSEFGHTLADLPALRKKPGTLKDCSVEGIASGTAILKRARKLGFRGDSVEQLVLEKNPRYAPLFDDMAWALALLCYNLSIGFNLDGIYLSGGLIKIRQLYLPQLKRQYKTLIRQFNDQFEAPIRIAATGNQAGFLGAACLPYLAKD